MLKTTREEDKEERKREERGRGGKEGRGKAVLYSNEVKVTRYCT